MAERLISFGVELEFLCGEVLPHRKVKDGVKRTVKFPAAEGTKKIDKAWTQKRHDTNLKKRYAAWEEDELYFDSDTEDEIEEMPFYNWDGLWNDVADHIIQTLVSGGLNVEMSREDDGTTTWVLKQDPSVNVTLDMIEKHKKNFRQIFWHSFEIVSPAFYYAASSLKEVQRLCYLLHSSYIILTNNSIDPKKGEVNISGLHCHVGNGTREGFSLEHTRRIAAFLYVFEPILNSLHPEMRQDSFYSRGLRNFSRFSKQRLSQAIPPPSAIEGAAHFLNCKSFHELCRDIANNYGADLGKYMFYNFKGLNRKGWPDEHLPKRPTIEFREAEGTTDGMSAMIWAKACCQMIDWCIRASPERFHSLLSLAAEDEKWTDVPGRLATSDRWDNRRADEAGQVFNQDALNVVDLFRHMGLVEQAEFYEKKGFNGLWQYVRYTEHLPFEDLQQLDGKVPPVYRRYVELSARSFVSRRAAAHAEITLGWEQKTKFDPTSSIYPPHEKQYNNVNIDADDEPEDYGNFSDVATGTMTQSSRQSSDSNGLGSQAPNLPSAEDDESPEERIDGIINFHTAMRARIKDLLPLGPIV